MPFDAKDFYALAVWLVQNRTSEASLRTAISRAYYTGHLLAVQKLKEKGWEPTGKGDDHGRVIHELGSRRFRNLAEELRRLRALREHADYHLEASDSVFSKDCEFCKKIREAVSPSDPVVNQRHWKEAKEVGEHLFPLLEKL